MCTLLDLCVSSLRRGHANLLCIVPILTDDPRRESENTEPKSRWTTGTQLRKTPSQPKLRIFPLSRCRAFVGHLSDICRAFVGHLSGICRAFVAHLSGICRAFVGHLSGICRAFVGHLPRICRAFIGHLSGICRAFVAHLSRIWTVMTAS